MVLAFLAGLGGGNFSSFMPSTSLFFPKRLQGTALAIQAGIGNFGVSVVQFVTPWIIGFALAGSLLGGPQTLTRPSGETAPIWLQNATAIYIPFIVLFGIVAWLVLRSVPVRANFREQLDIFREKHGFNMTLLYIMTFGSFSGLSATFPLLIKQIYGPLPGAPDPLDLRLPRTAGRLDRAHHRRAGIGSRRRRPRHPLVRDRHVRLGASR